MEGLQRGSKDAGMPWTNRECSEPEPHEEGTEGTDGGKGFLLSKANFQGTVSWVWTPPIEKETYLLLRRKDHYCIDTLFLSLSLLKDLNSLHNSGRGPSVKVEAAINDPDC